MADRFVGMVTGTVHRASDALRHDHVPMLAVVSAGWFLSLGVRLVYPVLLPHLRAAYGLDLTTAGLLLTVLWLAYALGQLPAGVLADRIGEGRVLAISCFLAAGTLLFVVLADSALALFAGTVALALGLTLYGVARFVILADLFPDNVGTATGVTLAAGDAGNAVLPPLAGVLAVVVAWQAGFGILVPAFALAGLACWIVLPAATSDGASAVDTLSLSTVRDVLGALNRPAIVRGTALLLVGNAVWQAFTGFYPTYLVEMKGLSPTTAGAVFGGFFGMGILVKPLAGAAYDRVGIRRSLAVIGGLMAVSLSAIPFVSGPVPVVAVTAVASAVLGYGTIALTYVTTALPETARSTGLGVVRTSYTTVGAASPLIFGALADRGYFDEGFLLLAGLSVLLALLAVTAPER